MFGKKDKQADKPVNDEKNSEEVSIEEGKDETSEIEDIKADFLQQIATLKDSLIRKAAEMENLRKRLEKEKDEAVKYANKNFAKDLLPVLDNFERIENNLAIVKDKIEQDPNLKAFFEGIAICEKELLAAFKRYGVSKVQAEPGLVFDHSQHQAMCEVEDDKIPEGSVVKVFQTGYNYHDRLLRPAMVSVSKKK